VTSANGTQSPALQKIQGGTSKLPLLPGHTLGQVTALGYNPNEQFPAGFSGDTSGNSRGVFWALNSSGAWVPNDIGDLGGGNAQILGSDKEGDWLCGWADVFSSNGQAIPRPFVYNIIQSVIIDLNPGYQSESKSFDCDIDSNGKVTAVGHIYSYLQYPSAAVFEPGQAPSLLGGTGGLSSTAYAIDDDHIVGEASTQAGGVFHAISWQAPNYLAVDLGTLGGSESRATSVSGLMVYGQAQIPSGEWRACYWDLSLPTAPFAQELSSLPAISTAQLSNVRAPNGTTMLLADGKNAQGNFGFVLEEFQLEVPPSMSPGTSYSLQASPILSGEVVYFGGALSLGSTVVPPVPGLLSDLHQPRLLGVGVGSSPSSEVNITVVAPPLGSGTPLYFQALTIQRGQVSTLGRASIL
jgi:hypothetical protein